MHLAPVSPPTNLAKALSPPGRGRCHEVTEGVILPAGPEGGTGYLVISSPDQPLASTAKGVPAAFTARGPVAVVAMPVQFTE
jgi:hypothetical protein